jgi:hypothetical protein
VTSGCRSGTGMVVLSLRWNWLFRREGGGITRVKWSRILEDYKVKHTNQHEGDTSGESYIYQPFPKIGYSTTKSVTPSLSLNIVIKIIPLRLPLPPCLQPFWIQKVTPYTLTLVITTLNPEVITARPLKHNLRPCTPILIPHRTLKSELFVPGVLVGAEGRYV